jgi:hypothetical protein
MLTILLSLVSVIVRPEEASVVFTRGNVELISGQKLNSEDVIPFGETIVTGKQSVVRIRMPSEGVITIGPQSKLLLESTGHDQKTSVVKLIGGQIRAKFSKKKNKKYKLITKTKTSSLGIRGTEFHLVHNEINNVSTAVSYEGEVDFYKHDKNDDEKLPEIESQFTESQSVKIRPGEFSGSFSDDDFATQPVKFSPKQYAVLRDNQKLLMGIKKGIKEKGSKKTKKLSKSKATSLNQSEVTKKNSSLIPVPKELVGDGFQDIDDIREKKSVPRPGGYIDLGTGTYVAPPPNSQWDEEKQVFIPPDDYGSINFITGEYIPPMGLVLLPLKGFVVASASIQKGVKVVREKIGQVGAMVGGAVMKTGQFIGDAAKIAAKKFVDNTGFVGSTAKTVGTTVADGISKGSGMLANASSTMLNGIADQMNKHINQGLFKYIREQKNKYLKEIQLKVSNTLETSEAHPFYLYNNMLSLTENSSFSNELDFRAAYKKKFLKKWFIRPKARIEKVNYLKRSRPELRRLDNYRYSFGTDFGIQTKIKKMLLQTYFFGNISRQRRFVWSQNRYFNFNDDYSLGISKLLVGSSRLSSRFDYSYTKYRNATHHEGEVHRVFLGEIVGITKKDFFELDLGWEKQTRTLYRDAIRTYSAKLTYFKKSPVWNMSFKAWGQYLYSKLGIEYFTRGNEKQVQAGVDLKKNFKDNFSVEFHYRFFDNDSNRLAFEVESNTFGTQLAVQF